MKEKSDLKINSQGNKELEKAQEQFDEFEKNVKDLTLDRMNAAPKQEMEPIHKIAQKDLEKSNDIYLKPFKSIGSAEKFNERFRDDYNFSMEYVRFIPEFRELIGETIELWTKPFPGMPAEFWQVPSGKPVWGPRHLAERLAGCKYHRLVMKQNISTGMDGLGQYYGAMAADTQIQRIDALPVSTRKSVFMGATSF